jgi:RNA polymerase sigma-70 factor (ECF subfamily)
VLDYSLVETAELVGSTVGGVKAALNRGRAKLAELPASPTSTRAKADPAMTRLLSEYVDRFNRRDWSGVRELISADAGVAIADRFVGRLADSPYLGRYDRKPAPWHMAVGDVDGELVILVFDDPADLRVPRSMIRITALDGQVARVADYSHCPWMVSAARSTEVTHA